MFDSDRQTWYCESCNTNTPFDDICERYREEAGHTFCSGCISGLMERCVIHVEQLDAVARLSVEFDEDLFTTFCNNTDILYTAIISHGYEVKGHGEGWTDIDQGDMLIMKLGTVDHGLQSIVTSVIIRMWELY